jgi:hypothetical protein
MSPTSLSQSEKIIIAVFAIAAFLLHFITNLTGAYGFFRDELYYIACSEHLAWGYVDQPPFSIFVLKISRVIFGDSLAAIRLIPSVAHAATIVVTGFMVKEMGGRSFAVFLACLGVFVSLIHIGMCLIFSMNSIDIFLWALAAYILLRIINTQNNYFWIVLGFVLGIGLLNKISVLFLGAGIFTGLILTNPKVFKTRWPYLAGIIALLLFSPYIIWNLKHDLAHLEFMHNASSGKYSGRSSVDFVVEQILLLNPVNLPIWIAGLFALLFYPPLKKFRIFAWIYLTAFIILFVNRTSKGEYLSPAYAMLFAAAGIFIEEKFKTTLMGVIKYAYSVLLFVSMIILLPAVLPVLPVEDYIAYSKKLGVEPNSSENKELAELPQFYADMFGWKEKAKDVARVYNSLNPEDQKKCIIFSTNYGRCGAIDFFGEAYGLPKSIGSHNNYWLWGPGDKTGEVVIILGGIMEEHKDDFASCELAGVSTCTYCMPYENNVNIFLCRGLKQLPAEGWSEEKHYE